MFPYAYKREQCSNHNELMQMSKEICDAIYSGKRFTVNQDPSDDCLCPKRARDYSFLVHRKNFVYGDISTIIYPASGSTADWAYDTADIPCAYAPELRDQGEYGFLIPENQIIPVAEEMYAGFITMADQVLAGRCDNK